MVMDAQGIVKAIQRGRRGAVNDFTRYASAKIGTRTVSPKTIIDLPRLKATQRNFGWIHVEYTDPKDPTKKVGFNVRPSFLKDLEKSKNGYWNPMAERAYKKWREETRAGQEYGVRRQIEGMKKTAEKKGMTETAEKLDKILQGDKRKMMDWYADKKRTVTNLQWDEFFAYDSTVDASGLEEGDFDQ